MSKKELKEEFRYGFIDENGKHIDIPKNIQKSIEEREKLDNFDTIIKILNNYKN